MLSRNAVPELEQLTRLLDQALSHIGLEAMPLRFSARPGFWVGGWAARRRAPVGAVPGDLPTGQVGGQVRPAAQLERAQQLAPFGA